MVFSYFSRQPQFDPATDIPDMTGKVVLVTGGNGGMGYQVVEQLALRNAKVWMGARSEERARAAIQKIEETNPHLQGKNRIDWLPLDLASVSGTKKAATAFLGQNGRLDGLVLNAAIMMQSHKENSAGMDESIVINHISHQVLTTDLLPLMKRTAALPQSDVRIVTIASAAHTFTPAGVRFDSWDDLNRNVGSGPRQYAFTKLANILFAKELDRRLTASNSPIISLSLHPGLVATGGGLDLMPGFIRPIMSYVPGIKSPIQGALNALFAVGATRVREESESFKGAYLMPVAKIAEPTKDAQDSELAMKLWKTTEQAAETLLARERGKL